ncbi:MBL fold metallo-hydrolase [Chelatococcus asaccharovorans]|uniref:MBL fold metallo-hydrolase n=1 Tax=Chelatococcus asaccharovorans TaxID=28210 RepID=UPI000D76DB4F|nr:MBL fold metallo-hydrolase [Chelatococcus asaccharovorans]
MTTRWIRHPREIRNRYRFPGFSRDSSGRSLVPISVHVLGSSGGYPANGQPCSGYLVRGTAGAILLDCGPGVATALLRDGPHCNLDAIAISHLHPDHTLDLIPLAYSLLTEWLVDGRTVPLPLFVPLGGIDFLRRFSDLFGHRQWRLPTDGGSPGKQAIATSLAQGQDWVFSVFDIREYMPGDDFGRGDLTVRTHPVDHGVPTAAMRIDDADKSVVYSADTRFLPSLASFASRTDLFFLDAHLSGLFAPGGAHMTPMEAGRLGAMAEASELVLCHLATPEDGDSARRAAAVEFKGPIHLACQTSEYAL